MLFEKWWVFFYETTFFIDFSFHYGEESLNMYCTYMQKMNKLAQRKRWNENQMWNKNTVKVKEKTTTLWCDFLILVLVACFWLCLFSWISDFVMQCIFACSFIHSFFLSLLSTPKNGFTVCAVLFRAMIVLCTTSSFKWSLKWKYFKSFALSSVFKINRIACFPLLKTIFNFYFKLIKKWHLGCLSCK